MAKNSRLGMKVSMLSRECSDASWRFAGLWLTGSIFIIY